MKTLELSTRPELEKCFAEARSSGILLTREGKPAGLLIDVENYDEEDWVWATDPEFWHMIAESRQQSTLSLSELQERLRRHDEQV